MRKFALGLLALLSGVTTILAQTTLIDPAQDGGFELGNTFAANGWTVVNSTGTTVPNNNWKIGTAASSFSTQSAYITNGAGTAHDYDNTKSSVVFFYKDVTFPAGAVNTELKFKWYSGGESTWDHWQVYMSATSFTPSAAVTSTSGNAQTNNYFSGNASLIGGGNLNTTVQNASYCLPTTLTLNSTSASTRRLIFVWRNDGSGGTQPPVAFDSISLISGSIATPPTVVSVTLSSPTYNGFSGSWTGNPPTNTSGYLVLAAPAGSAAPVPVNGTTYTVGSTIGSAIILANGTATSFTTNVLNAATSYDVYVFPYWNNTCAGPGYLAGSANGTITTAACSNLAPGTYSVGPTGTYPSLTAVSAALGAGTALGNAIFELQPAYNSNVETYPIVFSQSACPQAGSVIIRPATGATNLSISGTNTTALIDLNNFKRLTIDGRAGGTGTTSNLSIINSATSGTTIRLYNDASNNTITYCDVQGQSATNIPNPTSTTQGGVIYFGAANATTLQGNDNNTISFCNLHSTSTGTPTVIILSAGTNSADAAYNDGNVITNNSIYDYFHASNGSNAIKLDAGNNAWTISNNSFYQTATRTYTTGNTHRAIWITPLTASPGSTTTGNGFIVTGNFIGGTAPNAGGTPLTMAGSVGNSFWGMDISVGVGTPTSVQNNTITNINVTTTSTTNGFVGISQNQGSINMGTVTGNMIGSATSNGAITVTNATTGGGIIYGLRISGGTNATVNIQNNTVAGINATGTGTLGHSIYAIANTNTGSSGVTFTINNNTIGSTTVANSLSATNATTANNQAIVGIYVAGGASTNSGAIIGNTISNLTNNYTGTSSTGYTAGIVLLSSTGINLSGVNNNIIRNLSTGSTSTNTGLNSAVMGIGIQNTNASGITATGNTIHTLRLHTAAGTFAALQATGMFIGGSSSATNTFSNNFIHSFDLVNAVADTNVVMTGIDFSGATASFVNNMIRLGIQSDGSSITTGLTLRGISSNSSSTLNNFYFNTIYIGGTGVTGTTAKRTFAFTRTSNNGTYDVRNNIFVNDRSNATNLGSHYAIYLNSASTTFSPDYNLYRYTGTGGVFAFNGTANVPVYTSGWLSSDTHSTIGDPLLANPTGTAANVDLHLTQSTAAEGVGIAIPAITTDFDGDIRANFTPTDIGADAGNYAPPGTDLGILSLDSPVPGICATATTSGTVTVTLKNFSIGAHNFVTKPATITVTATGGTPYSSTIVINTGSLAANGTQQVTLPATASFANNSSNYVFNASVSVATDINAANDAISPVTIAVKPSYTLTPGTGQVLRCGTNSPTLAVNTVAPSTASIQWLLFNNPVSGATGSTFLPTAGGEYRAVVMNPAVTGCGDTSGVINLFLDAGPAAITVTPSSATICSNSPTAVQLNATGGGNVTSYYFGTKANTNLASTTATGYPAPYTLYYGGQRMQTLVLASELSAAGLTAGSAINSISFPVLSRGSNWTSSSTLALQGFRVKAGLTTQSTLTTFITNLSTLSGPAAFVPKVGYDNNHAFATNLVWDGTSNVVIETNFSNNVSGSTNDLITQWNSPTSFQSTIVYRADGINQTQADTAITVSFSYNARPDFILNTAGAGSLTWTPVTGLYTDPAATIAYTGGAAASVYAKPTAPTTYTVSASSPTGCTATKTVAVGLAPQPTITTQPVAQSVCNGANVSFSVVASNALGYQWQYNGVNIPGATSASITINNVSATNIGNYTVILTSPTGCNNVTSSVAALSYNAINSWTGAVSNDWNDIGNWCGGIPTSTTDVVIPSSAPRQPVLSTVGTVRNLTLNVGSQLILNNASTMRVFGNFVNNGLMQGTLANMEFAGSTPQTTSGMTIGSLVLNGTGGLTAQGNITTTGGTVFTNGNLTLGSSQLNTNSITGGSATSYVITNGNGAITMNNVSSSQIFPVGPNATSYNPVTIANGQGFNYGVKVAVGISPAVNNANLAVNRTWNISSTGTPITPVNITYQYADAHMNAGGTATNAMEVGVHNGTIWQIVSPSGGATPTGTATARQVTTGTFRFGPMAIGNITSISIATAVPGVDPELVNVQLMPNIVQNQALLRVNTRRAGMINWTITDASGKVVMQFSRQNTVGVNDIVLQLGQLAGGTYYIHGASDKGRTSVVRFIRQ